MSDQIEHLTANLIEFLSGREPGRLMSAAHKMETYTRSGDYLLYVTRFHHTPDLAAFLDLLLAEYIRPVDTIIDVGCASGFSGLSLALNGRQRLTFYDFEGLGLAFLRWMVDKESIEPARVASYGQPVVRHKWALCFDVLEHTGNHLGCLKWLEGLGENVALCYPLVGWQPPFAEVLDEWVDDDVIQDTIARRYQVAKSYIADGRRFTIYGV